MQFHPRRSHLNTEGEWKYRSTLSLKSSLDGVGGQPYVPTTLPLGKTADTHFYRKLGGTQSRSERAGKTSPLPVFDPRTVQPAVSSSAARAVVAPIVTLDLLQYWTHFNRLAVKRI